MQFISGGKGGCTILKNVAEERKILWITDVRLQDIGNKRVSGHR